MGVILPALVLLTFRMVADRDLAKDVRSAADIASQWANATQRWDDPDNSAAAIFELEKRLLATKLEDGPAVRATDVYLATDAVERLTIFITHLRRIPNAPDDFDIRGLVLMMLQSVEAEPLIRDECIAFVTED